MFQLFNHVYEFQSEISWEACILFNNKTPVVEIAALSARLLLACKQKCQCQVNYNKNKLNFPDI